MTGKDIKKLRVGLADVIETRTGVISQQALAEMIGSCKRSVAYWEADEKSPHPLFLRELKKLQELLPAGTR